MAYFNSHSKSIERQRRFARSEQIARQQAGAAANPLGHRERRCLCGAALRKPGHSKCPQCYNRQQLQAHAAPVVKGLS